MINGVPTHQPAHILKERNFYRGVLLIPLLGAIGFILMVTVEPSPATSFLLQWIFCITLLAVAIWLRKKNRNFGLGMILGWALFVLFPIVWILLLGFSGNLM